MPKIKVSSTSSIFFFTLTVHKLTFHISCDTTNILTDSFTANCDLASSATAVAPSNVQAGSFGGQTTVPSTAELKFTTATQVAAGSSYTLTIANPPFSDTWSFDDAGTVLSSTGSTNAAETNVVIEPQNRQKKRSFWQRIFDFFKRLFN